MSPCGICGFHLESMGEDKVLTFGTDYSSTAIPAPTPENGALGNANMLFLPTPDQAGRWSDLLIIAPIIKLSIVSVVCKWFLDEREHLVANIVG